MTGHIHAELMAQYAEDAKTHERPWELWEETSFKNSEDHWRSCRSHIFLDFFIYRRKPKTVTINGFEVVDDFIYDYLNMPHYEYFVENPMVDGFYSVSQWDGEYQDTLRAKRGIAHYTKEGAIAACKARLGINPK